MSDKKMPSGSPQKATELWQKLSQEHGEPAAKVKTVFNFSCFIENTGDAAIHTRTTYENTLSWKVIYHTKGPQQVLNDPNFKLCFLPLGVDFHFALSQDGAKPVLVFLNAEGALAFFFWLYKRSLILFNMEPIR